jgi:hypothetical protein
MAVGTSKSTTSQVSTKPEILHLATTEPAEACDKNSLCSKGEDDAYFRHKNEFNTMPELPARKGQETFNSPRTPKSSRRGANSISTATNKKTPRQGSAYSSTKGFQYNESDVDGEIQPQQIKPRDRIATLRPRILQIRQLRRRRRDELHQLREDVRGTLDILTRKVNELVAVGKVTDDVRRLYEKFHAAQDRLGPAEEAYDNLERKLDWEEEKLEHEEGFFYQRNNQSPLPIPESRVDQLSSPLAKSCEPPEAEIQNLKLNDDPVQEYLEKVEEAYRLREELEDLEDEYCKVVETREVRKRHHIEQSEQSTNFLEDYPQLHKDILDPLQEAEQTLYTLRKFCLQQGLFADSEYKYRPHDIRDDIWCLLEEIQDRYPLRVAARHSNFPMHANDFSDKREYVNIWLLGWVQESPVDTLSLKNWIYVLYPEGPNKAKELEDDRWLDLVLENWNKDSMGVLTSKFNNASRLDAIAGETSRLHSTITGHSGISSSLRSLDVGLDHGGDVEQFIMGSETGSYATEKIDSKNPRARLDNKQDPSRLDVPSFPLQPSQSWPLSPKSTSEVVQSLSTSPPDQVPQIPAPMLDNSSMDVKRSIIIFNRVVKKRSSCPAFSVSNPDAPSQ